MKSIFFCIAILLSSMVYAGPTEYLEKYAGEYKGTLGKQSFSAQVSELNEFSTFSTPFLLARMKVLGATINVILGFNLTENRFEGTSSLSCDHTGCVRVDSITLAIRRVSETRSPLVMDIEINAIKFADEGDIAKDQEFLIKGTINKK